MSTMKLVDWLSITDGRVTEGSEFGFTCYGDRAYTLSYWNGMHGEEEVSTHVVYDRNTYDVYEVEAFDGRKSRVYTWRDPRYADAYKSDLSVNFHSIHEWEDIELELIDDFIAKATAIINGEEYDVRIKVPLEMSDNEVAALMFEAHRRDITLNQLIELQLRQAMVMMSEGK